MQLKRLVCCCCADYQKIDSDNIKLLSQKAKGIGIELKLIPDLCYEAVQNPAIFKSFADENILLAVCKHRVAKALFARVEAQLPQILAFDEEDFCSRLENLSSTVEVPDEIIELPLYKPAWKAWYPLIDPELCNNCGKCLDFCLFGVYGRNDDDRVIVAQPAECKTNCPACARVCPQQAIIFPKHDQQPFDGSAIENKQPIPQTFEQEDELYDILAKRRRKARRKLLKDKPDDS